MSPSLGQVPCSTSLFYGKKYGMGKGRLFESMLFKVEVGGESQRVQFEGSV